MHDRLRKLDPARLAFAAAVLFFAFLLGGLFATMQWQPYQMFEDGLRTARQVYRERTQTRPELLEQIRFVGDGVTIHEDGAWRGLTAMQGLFPEGVELRLVDMAGKVVHRWPADFYGIWPDPVHVYPPSNRPIDELHYQTHGMSLLPDGSVVFNFDNLGTVKLDKCGEIQWRLDRATHHAVTPNPDGTFWIPVRGDLRQLEAGILLETLTAADLLKSDGRYEDRLLLVGADGRIIREISLLQALFNGSFAAELFDVREFSVSDPTHLNDIEVVTPELAARIPGVEPGDLLVSMRQMHMLAILDRATGEIKWRQTGPWVREHDPDITADGLIEVFNNGDGRLPVKGVVGSSILSLDPATGAAWTVYPLEGQAHFFTRFMGGHQRLPNGNRLITESLPGRVFEIDAQGKVVWEYVKPYDDTHAALIQSAIRYDEDYFTVEDWSCPAR